MRKGQGRKPLLNVRDHRALRLACTFENHCHSTQSATTSRNATWNCIMQIGRHLLIFAQKRRRVLWAQNHLRWTERQWKRVLWSDKSAFQHFRKSGSMCQRWKRPSRLLPMKSAKTSLCDGMGVHQWVMWRYHCCRGLCWNFGKTYAAVNTTTFPTTPCLIHQDNARAMSYNMSYNSVAS